jgi:hypothetical protein
MQGIQVEVPAKFGLFNKASKDLMARRTAKDTNIGA